MRVSFSHNVPLAEYSNYRIGGAAQYFVRVKDREALKRALARASEEQLPVRIIGGGTNLLIRDEGVPGLVVKPEIDSLDSDGPLLTVGAGVPVSHALDWCIRKGFSGLEWAGGLPGSVGGAVRGNAGAFGGEIKDAIVRVTSLTVGGRPKLVRRLREQCRFGYRTSVFKEKNGKEVIVEAVLRLRPGDPQAIRAAIEEKIKYRRERHPLEYPNIGSIFKNVDVRRVPKALLPRFQAVVKTDPFPVIPTAYLISEAGLKGVAAGGAMISPKHPNFIVNVLQATAADVKTLIALAKVTVEKQFGVVLEEEVIYV